jgi:ribosomal-protein-alanine N-acetyltransferase
MTAELRTTVREARPGDIRAIVEAEEICFPDPWPGGVFSSELFAPARFNQVVVDASGRLLAYLFAAWQFLDLHVLKVATLPEMRRSGFARQLMEIAERHAAAQAGESITLEVRESNVEAMKLYLAMGYDNVGLRPSYYRDGEDAVVMTKVLSQNL